MLTCHVKISGGFFSASMRTPGGDTYVCMERTLDTLVRNIVQQMRDHGLEGRQFQVVYES